MRRFTKRGKLLRTIKKDEIILEATSAGILAGGIIGELVCVPFLGPGAITCASAGAAIGAKAGLVEGQILGKRYLKSKPGIKLGMTRK